MRDLKSGYLLFVLGCMAGCADLADSEDEPAVSVADEELVGGFATAARPEVGRFFNGAGSSCTATLIAPRIVATAAHCLEPMYTATTVAAGAAFQFTDAGGTLRTYSVNRVHSFATKRFEFVPAGTFTTDLAILRLTAEVPPAQAVPADISLQQPFAGNQSTIFGFGCTDRTPASGGGFKQARTFNFGTATSALCWGDSGGPVTFGTATGGAALWGVNSDFNFVGGTDDWTDIFADVPLYRKQIEDIIRAWDGANEIGWNRPGMDYANVLVASAAACRTTCETDGACAAFTFTPEGAGGRCRLKNGAPEPFLAWNNAVVSGLANKFEFGIDRFGAEYAGFAPPEARAESCAAACGRDHGCHGWTYEATGVGTGMCWLRNGTPARSSCAICTTGVVKRDLEVGYNRPGSDFAVRTAATPNQCADLCAQDDRCESYTHTNAATNNCWLKDAVPWATTTAGTTSGVRGGLETNTDRLGSDYRSFLTTRLSPTVCQAACAAEAPCVAWTYVPPAAASTAAGCFLKNAIPARSFRSGMVSGLKGLEMLH